ncbi:MAG: MetQ/NlpA family lipoprotein [Verrucomicrobia bacterium]|nr:MetQ/NlpA family lipoprotein [Verrucomicrobiota bacterium]
MKFLLPLLLLTTLALTACQRKKTEDHLLKVGVISGRESELMETAAKIAKEKYNLTVQIVTFSDYTTPNIALNDGSIDVNVFQHRPYLEAQVTDHGYHLVPVGNTFIFPLAAYSKKINQLNQLREGAKIALPNDPTNLGRALLLLQKQGLIKLKENVGLTGTPLDIVENPKHLQFIELEAAQLPRSLEDVDVAIINTTYASQINLLPTRDGLFVEEKDSPYVNIIVAREENQNRQEVQEFIKAYQSAEVLAQAQKLFGGGIIQGW